MRYLVAMLALISGLAGANQATDPLVSCLRANLPRQMTIGSLVIRNESDGMPATRFVARAVFIGPGVGTEAAPPRGALRIREPSAFAGAAYLVRDLAQPNHGFYVYLPALGQVRRVAANFGSGRLVDSEFEYDDLLLLRALFAEVEVTPVGAGSLRGRAIHRYRVDAKSLEQSKYQRIEAWVDAETCLPLQVEFFRNSELSKTLTVPVDALRKDGEYWYPSEIEAVDVASGRRSRATLAQVDIRSPIAERELHPHSFHLKP